MLLSAQIHLELEHDKTSCPLAFFSFCSLLLGDNIQGEAAGFTLKEKSWSGKRRKMTTVVQITIILVTEAAGLLLHAQTMVGRSYPCTSSGSPTPHVHTGQDRAGTCFSVFVLQKDPQVLSWPPDRPSSCFELLESWNHKII